MKRKILLIYQDCTDCGAIKDWAEKQRILAEKYHFKIEKMQFTSAALAESELHKKAFADGKIKSYPFFTDGKKFSKTLEDFIEEKPVKKLRRKKKVEEDEPIPED